MSQLPTALLQALLEAPGFRPEAFRQVHLQAPPTSVRLNPLKLQMASGGSPDCRFWFPDWSLEGPVPWCSQAWYLAQRPEFPLEPLWHAGAFYVQEASSMLLAWALKTWLEDRPLLALDLCAAPGGKSTLLCDALPKGSLLLANELIGARNRVLQENLTKWGRAAVVISQNDPADFRSMQGLFDLIVVDAPCSGSGLLRKDPAAAAHWSAEAVAHCSLRQRRILNDISGCLKPEGVLVYATCSYSPEENEQLALELAASGDWTALDLELPDHWGVFASRTAEGRPLGLRCYPDRVRGEGFFFSGWRRGQGPSRLGQDKRLRSEIRRLPLSEQAASLVLKKPELACYKVRDQLFGFPAAWEDTLQLLASRLWIRQAGIRLGRPAKSAWIPEHALALSEWVHPEMPRLELSRTEALAYLRRETLHHEACPQGWALACYRGIALGWIKGVSGRINNYFPTEWRIRMSGASAEQDPAFE